MKKLLLLLGLSVSLLGTACAADTFEKEWRDSIEAQNKIIAAGGTDDVLSQAFYNRADAYDALGDKEKAAADINEALKFLQKLPDDQQSDEPQVLIWNLKGNIAVKRGQWEEAYQALEKAKKVGRHVEISQDPPLLYYNLSRAAAHLDLPYDSQKAAERALDLVKDKTDAHNVHLRMNSLRQKAVADFARGDLETAEADWAAAKALEPKIGKSPFDPAQAPLNKAVDNGGYKERIARARFLMSKVDLLTQRIKLFKDIAAVNNEPELVLSSGGTLSLADTLGPHATQLNLVDDAINDLDMAIHRDIGDTWGLQVFEIMLRRGEARALRYQLAPDAKKYSLHDVDDDLNRAVTLKPEDISARDVRSKWLTYRLDHLNEIAKQNDLTVDQREKIREALLLTFNDDLARIMLDKPQANDVANVLYGNTHNDSSRHVLRARLSLEQPMQTIAGKELVGVPGEMRSTYVDNNAALYDLDAALKNPLYLSKEEKAWAEKSLAELNEKIKTKPEGTALEWKEKAKAAIAQNDAISALEDLNNALQIDPKFADALNNRSGSYRQRAQWDLALRDLDAAIQIEPKHRAAYMNRAAIKREIGDFDGALADARRAVEVAPDDNFRQAANKELLQSLFARADHLSNAKETLAASLADYHEGNTLMATLKLPPDADMLQYEGTVAAQSGKGAEALTALRAAHAAKPDDIWIEGWLTLVATALGEPDAADLEKDISTRGDRNTLENIDQNVVRVKNDGPRLTTQNDAEVDRLKGLFDRLFTVYRAKQGGLTISGAAK